MEGKVSNPDAAEPPVKSDRLPPGIPYIIGNEAAERFSYYGMRAILFVYMVALYLDFVPKDQAGPDLVADAEVRATKVAHLFFAGVYFFPMVGAILADRLFGKYPVIFWVSLVYCAGHAMLALSGKYTWGMYTGLTLIAIASGGIKPCVSANVGDQFTAANSHLVTKVYQIFYFSINFGSFFSQLLIPWIYKHYGPEVAFGVPGILMGSATLIFWLGRNKFVRLPPKPGGWLGLLDFFASTFLFLFFAVFVFAFLFELDMALAVQLAIAAGSLALWLLLFTLRQRIQPDAGFLSVLFYAIGNQRRRKPGMGFFDVAREKFSAEAAEGPPAVLRIMIVFSMVSVFWALFDQHASTWIKQSEAMDLTMGLGRWQIEVTAPQIQSLNPFFVMLIIPFLNIAVYRPLAKRGIVIKPLRRMTAGMFITSLSFVAAALVQVWIESLPGEKIHVAWQVIQYLLLTVGEVLVSITGLEFAYTQAPRAMKSTIMGFWLLTVTIGNLLVVALAPLQKLSLSSFFWTFAVLMAVAAAIFSVMAFFYKEKTYLQEARGQ